MAVFTLDAVYAGAPAQTHKSGTVIQFCFSISLLLHSRAAAKEFWEYLAQYLDCGKYYPCSGRNSGVFRVTSIADIADKIIPFFDNEAHFVGPTINRTFRL